MKRRNVWAVCLLICLLAGTVSGCSKEPVTPVARLGTETIDLSEAVFYTRMLQEQWEITYYQIYGEDMWQRKPEFGEGTGDTLGEALKETVMDTLTEIHLLCCDYEEVRGRMGGIQSQYHILFCAGMVQPALADVPFIYLEDIISFNQIETVKGYLSEYLNEQELVQFHRNLLKNFSLQNVIEYLTILNADKVLEFVDETLEQLQIALGRRFSAKTIIGLNIHISCLVERLVKKTPTLTKRFL